MNPTTPTTRRLRTVAGSAVLALALAACGSSGSAGSSSETSAASTAASAATTVASSAGAGTTAAAASPLKVSGAWARTSAATQDAGAAYMKIENPNATDDALVAVKVAATVAMEAQIHEVVPDTAMGATTTGMGGSTGSSATTAMGGSDTTAAGMGAMKMQPVEKIVVPAKGMVELKPGGYHVMLMKLAKPLVKGETFDVTLSFASGASSVVSVEVRDEA